MLVLNECHLRTNNILSSNSLETEGYFPHGQMPSIFMERPMCLPPKADKYREFLDSRKSMVDNIVSNFESFKNGNTEESIQVPNCKKN